MTEQQLIAQCKKQKPSAQQALYERYAPKMFGVCLRYVGDSETAKDLLQDAFVVVFQKLDSFKGDGSFEGWIRRIVVNTTLMHMRKSTLFVDYDDTTDHLSDFAVDAEGLEALSVKDLMNMIASLPNGYRTVFNLFAIEGYNHQEIADLLSISEVSSRSQYSRARKQLQKLIIEEYGESFRKRQV